MNTHEQRARESQASHGFTQTLAEISAWKKKSNQKWETSYTNTSKFEQRPRQFPQRPQESNTVKIKSSQSEVLTSYKVQEMDILKSILGVPTICL